MSVKTPRMLARTERGQAASGFMVGHFLTWRTGVIGAKSRTMIPRYSRPQMAAIWAPANRFRIWFEIEAHACDAMAELGVIPKDAAKPIWAGGKTGMEALRAAPAGEVQQVPATERLTMPDVAALPPWLGESIRPPARFVHQGLHSSDVLDPTFASSSGRPPTS